jgi:hypothetical protein
MPRCRPGGALLATLVLVACTARESVGTTYDLRWVGAVTPDAGRCPPPTQGTMTMVTADRTITFTPNDGALVLRGELGSDGVARAKLDAAGAEHRAFPLRFEAKVTEAGVSGSYTSPVCHAHVELHLPQPIPRQLFAPGNILGIGDR